MGKVVSIGNVSRLDISVDKILEGAKGQLEGVVLIGFEKETGEVYAASSYADGGTVMWLLEACKTKMMQSIGEPDEY